MSREYRMHFTITNHDKEKEEDIIAAIEKEWNIEDTVHSGLAEQKTEITMSGESALCGGESEEEFARRIVKAVYKANEKSCAVAVTCIYLEDLPSETYSFDNKTNKEIVEEILEEIKEEEE